MQADGTEKKLGAYLMKTCFQTSTISSAMFITAMAANPLAVDLAKDALGQTISWGQWALAGAFPGRKTDWQGWLAAWPHPELRLCTMYHLVHH